MIVEYVGKSCCFYFIFENVLFNILVLEKVRLLNKIHINRHKMGKNVKIRIFEIILYRLIWKKKKRVNSRFDEEWFLNKFYAMETWNWSIIWLNQCFGTFGVNLFSIYWKLWFMIFWAQKYFLKHLVLHVVETFW